MSNKIIRTICYFIENPTGETVKTVDGIADILTKAGFTIQTKRICSPSIDDIKKLEGSMNDSSYLLGVGTLDRQKFTVELPKIMSARNISWNLDITESITEKDIDVLLKIIHERPELTFNFAYVTNNALSSPYFPSANFEKEGFTIGLQPTDLSEGYTSVDPWLNRMKTVWEEIASLFQTNPQFLGIDSSIAPLFTESGSFVSFIKRLGMDFSRSVTTDTYVRITKFIKKENPKPVGLCGMMFPCLEDFELAHEYEKGNFSVERNIFLSLHSGLGIDTYPIGVDETPQRIIEILLLVQALSNKYTKPLSIRFVSDGKAKIGQKTNFQNQYLKDVTIKPL